MSSGNCKGQKLTNFTPDDINNYLSRFRKAILDNKYTISKINRQENNDFIEDYKITKKKEHLILLSLIYDDFCYAVPNDTDKEEFAHEVLYIFCKEMELDYWGTLEQVKIYIKINMTQTRRGDDYVIIVSFHKLNYPIDYLFK